MHLCCQKLRIFAMPMQSIRGILKLVQLDSVQDLEVNWTWKLATGQVRAAPGLDGQPVLAAALAHSRVAAHCPQPGGVLHQSAHGLVPALAPLAGALTGLHLLPRWPPAPGDQVRHGPGLQTRTGLSHFVTIEASTLCPLGSLPGGPSH